MKAMELLKQIYDKGKRHKFAIITDKQFKYFEDLLEKEGSRIYWDKEGLVGYQVGDDWITTREALKRKIPFEQLADSPKIKIKELSNRLQKLSGANYYIRWQLPDTKFKSFGKPI